MALDSGVGTLMLLWYRRHQVKMEHVLVCALVRRKGGWEAYAFVYVEGCRGAVDWREDVGKDVVEIWRSEDLGGGETCNSELIY